MYRGDRYIRCPEWAKPVPAQSYKKQLMLLYKQKPSSAPVWPDVDNRTLDAPNALDNFYLKRLTSHEDRLFVILGQWLYCWRDSQIDELSKVENEEEYYKFINYRAEKIIAAGDGLDLLSAHGKKLGVIKGRYFTCEFFDNHVFAGGEKSLGEINIFDDRQRLSSVLTVKEVGASCQIAFADKMMAVGTNEGCQIRDLRIPELITNLPVGGTVKGLVWSGHQIITGGCLADTNVICWNYYGEKLWQVDAKAQACDLLLYEDKVFVATGFSPLNENVGCFLVLTERGIIHKVKVTEKRCLDLALLDDGNKDLITLSADELIKFWRIKNGKKKKKEGQILPLIR